MVTEPTSEIRSEIPYFDLDYLESTLGQFNNTILTIAAVKKVGKILVTSRIILWTLLYNLPNVIFLRSASSVPSCTSLFHVFFSVPFVNSLE